MLGFERLSAAFAGITIRTRLIAALTVVNIALAGALVFAPQPVDAQFPGDPCDPELGETWCECWAIQGGGGYCGIAVDVTEEGCQGGEACHCTEPQGCTVPPGW